MMLPAAAVALVWLLRLAGAGPTDLSGPEGLVLPDALSSEVQDLLGMGLTPVPATAPQHVVADNDGEYEEESQEVAALPTPAPLSSPPGRRSASRWGRDNMVSPEDFDFMTILRPPPIPTARPTASTSSGNKGRKQNKNKGNKVGGKGGKRGKQGQKQSAKQSPKQSPKQSQKQGVGGGNPAASSYSQTYVQSYPPSYAAPGFPPSYAAPGFPSSYPPSYLPTFSPSYPPALFSPNVYPPDFHPPYHPPHADPYANHLMEINHHIASELGPSPLPMREPSVGDVFQSSSSSPFLDLDSYQKPQYSTAMPTFSQHSDQRPSGSASVQLSQSVSAGEHHSIHSADPGWLAGLQQTTLPPPSSSSTTLAPASSTTSSKKATLRDILSQDCPGAEDLGYCDSPPRYPTQQVSDIIQKCSHLVDYMYAPLPEDFDSDAENNSVNDGAEAQACQAVRRVLRPGYVRDAVSGRWLVAVQSRAAVRVEQRVAAERCAAPGRACARLAQSKCARNLGFRNGARATTCDQRFVLTPMLTWDPEAPTQCPRMRQTRFPSSCVCRLS